MRQYDDETTIDDKQSCDQIEAVCQCGHRASLTWGLWSRQLQMTPLRKIQPRIVCKRCGARRSTIKISTYQGAGMGVVWQWPKA